MGVRSARRRSLAILASTVAICAVTAAHAQSAGYTIDRTSGTYGESSGDYTLGNQFTVGPQSVTVNALGYYDGTHAGLNASHDLAILDASGNIVSGSVATVPDGSGSPLIGDFRYVNLAAPVTLLAGQTYTVAGSSNGDAYGYTFGGSAITNDNRIGYQTSTFNFGNDFSALPYKFSHLEEYNGPNLLLAGSQMAEVAVNNSGFEDNAGSFDGSTSGAVGEGGNPAISGWTSTGITGINTPQGPGPTTYTNGPSSAEGEAAAFLLARGGTGASISQSIAGFVAGNSYAVTFYNSSEYGDDPTLTVTIAGQQIYSSAATISDGSTDFGYAVTDTFTATSTGAMTLMFSGENTTNPGNDASVLLDRIHVVQVSGTGFASAPEPGALALIAGGMGILPIGLLWRRRKANAMA